MNRTCAAFAVVLAAASMTLAGCGQREPVADRSSSAFDTPEAAVEALVAALEAHDLQRVQNVLGSGVEGLLSSGDEVADRRARDAFVAKYREQHRFVAGGPNDVVLQVGADDWPLPMPLVKSEGKWRFDAAAGAEELVLRRIGANELHTIDVMRGYVAAQDEYADASHDGAPEGIYARRLRSEPGRQDGLYWETSGDQPPSPAGPLLAAATAEGYVGAKQPAAGAPTPYHGYVYRMLYAQGPEAPGGEQSYLVGDQLKRGFALIASPAEYGVSGVMTFIVSHDGVVWQSDLGSDTAKVAGAITHFNPDEDWTPLAPEAAVAQVDP